MNQLLAQLAQKHPNTSDNPPGTCHDLLGILMLLGAGPLMLQRYFETHPLQACSEAPQNIGKAATLLSQLASLGIQIGDPKLVKANQLPASLVELHHR